VFDYLERDYELPRQEKFSWKGEDGVTVERVEWIHPRVYYFAVEEATDANIHSIV